MIVRDLGDSWQVVLQTDHAALSGRFAAAWAEPLPASLRAAAARHDDGWAVWETTPRADDKAPVNFLDVPIETHLALYRAGIAVLIDEDPLAGLLVSMHGAGLYRQRYGLDAGMRAAFEGEEADRVEAFVVEQESRFPSLAARAGVDEVERRRLYDLLQLFDRLSLVFCMRDLSLAEPIELQGWRLEPVGPFHLRMTPFPFQPRPARFTLARRVIRKGFADEEQFRELLAATPAEAVEITVAP